jgi:hypothetical protein
MIPTILIEVPISMTGKVDLRLSEVDAGADMFNSSGWKKAQKLIDKVFGSGERGK